MFRPIRIISTKFEVDTTHPLPSHPLLDVDRWPFNLGQWSCS